MPVVIPIPNLPDLINLKKLELVRSAVPEEIMELPWLEKLHISRSNASILLDEIGAFPMLLKELSIADVNLHCLRRLPVSLYKLSTFCCHSLARLEELSTVQNLLELWIHSCPELVEIEGLEMLEPLRSLHVSSCEDLERLDDLLKLSALEYLRIVDVPVETLSG